jgi:hypothetical protein
MIVNDLDIPRPIVGPHEADAPLVVDPNAVLTRPIASQHFEAIAWRCCQIAWCLSVMQLP